MVDDRLNIMYEEPSFMFEMMLRDRKLPRKGSKNQKINRFSQRYPEFWSIFNDVLMVEIETDQEVEKNIQFIKYETDSPVETPKEQIQTELYTGFKYELPKQQNKPQLIKLTGPINITEYEFDVARPILIPKNEIIEEKKEIAVENTKLSGMNQKPKRTSSIISSLQQNSQQPLTNNNIRGKPQGKNNQNPNYQRNYQQIQGPQQNNYQQSPNGYQNQRNNYQGPQQQQQATNQQFQGPFNPNRGRGRGRSRGRGRGRGSFSRGRGG